MSGYKPKHRADPVPDVLALDMPVLTLVGDPIVSLGRNGALNLEWGHLGTPHVRLEDSVVRAILAVALSVGTTP